MFRRNIFFVLLFVVAAFVSCEETNDAPVISVDPVVKQRLLVSSEGQYGAGTSSLTLLYDDRTVMQDMFRLTNDRTIGDIAQSISRVGDNFYVSVSNSKKVEVFNAYDFKSVETISIDGYNNPVHTTHLGGDSLALRASGTLYIVDLNHSNPDREKVRRSFKTIGGWNHQTVLVGDKLFVAGSSSMVVYDLDNLVEGGERVIKNTQGKNIGANAVQLMVDKNGLVWTRTKGTIYAIDAESERVVNEIDITGVDDTSFNPQCLAMNNEKDKIYYNAKRSIYEIDVDFATKPTEPIFTPEIEEGSEREGKTIYYMNMSKENTIFMIEVQYGSLARSVVYEYDLFGKEIQNFEAGIFSNFIYFY